VMARKKRASVASVKPVESVEKYSGAANPDEVRRSSIEIGGGIDDDHRRVLGGACALHRGFDHPRHDTFDVAVEIADDRQHAVEDAQAPRDFGIVGRGNDVGLRSDRG